MFEKELQFFITHQDELVAKHRGKVLVLHKDQVFGAYDSPLEAYTSASRALPVGTFMIQPCEPGASAYTVTINSFSS